MRTFEPSVRPSPIAGRWYEGVPDRLAQAVDQYIAEAELPELAGEVIAVIAPHAGHVYSGWVAGHAFAAIQHTQPEVVVVLSPLHQYGSDPVYSTLHSAYQTPLGSIPVDHNILAEVSKRLEQKIGASISLIQRDGEHSLEIELPFLQRIYPYPFQLLPLMVRDHSLKVTRALGQVLFDVLQDKQVMVVASTDLSHFYPQPVAEQLDAGMLQAMLDLSPADMLRLEAAQEGFACGLGAVSVGITYAKLAGASQATLLCYSTSGEITGDNTSVVGYGSIAITRKKS